MREARIHVRHVRDLLESLDPVYAFNGIDCASLSFLHTVTHTENREEIEVAVENREETEEEALNGAVGPVN